HDGRAGADGLGCQVDEHEPRLLAVGQPEVDKVAGPRVNRGAGLDAKRSVTLPAVPLPYSVAGIAGGNGALALAVVQEVDAIWRVASDRSRGIEQPLLVACERKLGEVVGHDSAVT